MAVTGSGTIMTEQEWRNQLKVGDEVVILSSGAPDSISTIARITKTLLIIGGADSRRKFRISDGCSPGGGYHHTSLAEPTQERTNEIRRVNLARWLRRVEWKTLSLETLREVYKLAKNST